MLQVFTNPTSFQVDLRNDMAFCRNGQLLERNGDGGSYLCTISKAPCSAGGRNGLFTWLQEPRRPYLNQLAKKASRVQVVFYFQPDMYFCLISLVVFYFQQLMYFCFTNFVDDGSHWENILATKATSLLQTKPKKFTPTSTRTKLQGAYLAQPTALLTRQVLSK